MLRTRMVGWILAGALIACCACGPATPGEPERCVATCQGRACGPDGCGGSCGACSGADVCNAAGQCVAENRPPSAVAGVAQQVAAGADVALDGSASSDPDGSSLTYAWRQLTGPAVALSGASTARATFTAPSPTDGTELTFELTVSDGTLGDSATTTVTVLAPPRLRFIAWGDTRHGVQVLAALSNQALATQPAFTLFAGDLEADGFTAAGMARFLSAMDGDAANGMARILFPTRGNHDSANPAGWKAAWALGATAARVGATHLAWFTDGLSYSFDHTNSHFVALDVPGDGTLVTAQQLAWLDRDLTAAEARGLTHAFLFWHGAIYPVGTHCCDVNRSVTPVVNAHPIVSGTFHGHEHVQAYVHIDPARIPGTTHEFEQFVSGSAGADPTTCTAGRTDACLEAPGYAVVDVIGQAFTVTWYELGAREPRRVFTFSKAGATPAAQTAATLAGSSRSTLLRPSPR